MSAWAQLGLVGMLALLATGCACGRYGTVAARRMLTPTAEVIDVYGFGALLRPGGVDGGFTLGWRHATYISPRLFRDETEAGARWTFGLVPELRAEPFFLAATTLGGEVVKYPTVLQTHVGLRTDAFTFAAHAEESRVVAFHYVAGAAEQTILAMNPLPKLLLP